MPPRHFPMGAQIHLNTEWSFVPRVDDCDEDCWTEAIPDEAGVGATTGRRQRRTSLACIPELDVLPRGHGRNLAPNRDRTFKPHFVSRLPFDVTPSALNAALGQIQFSLFLPSHGDDRSFGATPGIRSPGVDLPLPLRGATSFAPSAVDVTPPRTVSRLGGVSSTIGGRTNKTRLPPPPPTGLSPAEEMQELAATLSGKWVTDVKESDLYEPLLAKLGVSWMKRRIMNTCAIPIETSQDPADPKNFNIVATVVGVKKLLVWQLDGQKYATVDSDAGRWENECRPVDFEYDGVVVRALQQVRTGPLGRVEETRRVVHRPGMGEVMHIHFAMWPTKGPEELIIVNRYCRRQ